MRNHWFGRNSRGRDRAGDRHVAADAVECSGSRGGRGGTVDGEAGALRRGRLPGSRTGRSISTPFRDKRDSGTRSTASSSEKQATRCRRISKSPRCHSAPGPKRSTSTARFRNGLDDPALAVSAGRRTSILNAPNGTEFIQDPDHNRILLIDGENRDWKRIAMEPGRKHPSVDDLNPSYFGDAIGHWEGDTLVVDTVGFNEKFWAFRNGMPHTRFLHLTERYTRVDMNRINYEVTIDDKGAYTAPFSGGWYINWQSTNYDSTPNGEIHEYFCIDNERDSSRFERGTE